MTPAELIERLDAERWDDLAELGERTIRQLCDADETTKYGTSLRASFVPWHGRLWPMNTRMFGEFR